MERLVKEFFCLYDEVAKDTIIYIFLISFVLVSSVLLYFYDGNNINFFSYFHALKVIVPISIAMYIFFCFLKLLINKERHPINFFKIRIKLIYVYRIKLASSFILLTVMSVFISNFSTMKSMIPIFNMFKYDLLFQNLDRWLFLGNEPGLFIHNLIENPYVYFFISFCYSLWFFLMWSVLCYFLLTSHSNSRTRFFISWLLCWSILGIVIATIFSSVGPVFISRLNPDNHSYDLLMQALENKHDWLIEQGWPGLYSLAIQNHLWEGYINNKDVLGKGISAMPSMHVSIAVLMALSVSSVNKKIGYVFWLFAAVIFIGSFTLGWHYVVDGIVSAPLTLCIWHLSSYISVPSRQNVSSINRPIHS
ncbi:phosphatase PAP2 family protein [Vibrio harveyi]|uniref:phosphatase PAP2 family protein n=1 Tax=Vibrio harveyi TaxID=669 RepID=UPI0036F39BBD